MSTLRNLTRLIALLSSQRRVPREQIVEELGVSERSVYRYISRLSDANIPVYFDPDAGGYRLLQDNHWSGLSLTETETATTVIAMLHLHHLLPAPYGDIVRDAAIKLCGQRGLPVEDADALVEMPRDDCPPIDELVRSLSNGMVLYAIATGQSLQIEVDSGRDDGCERRTVVSPGLRFFHGWQLLDHEHPDQTAVPLERIKSAMLHRR